MVRIRVGVINVGLANRGWIVTFSIGVSDSNSIKKV
jgi:hypothetical protein